MTLEECEKVLREKGFYIDNHNHENKIEVSKYINGTGIVLFYNTTGGEYQYDQAVIKAFNFVKQHNFFE